MSEELHDSVVRNSLQSVEFSVDTLTLGEPRIDDLEGCLPVTLSDSEGAGESARAEVGYLIREGKEGNGDSFEQRAIGWQVLSLHRPRG